MKILQVVPTYWPAERYGGPIHSVHGLSRALVEQGHEVTVATTNVDGAQRLEPDNGAAKCVDGVAVRYFKVGFGQRLYWSLDMLKFLHRHTGEFDVVHCHSVFLLPTSFARYFASRFKVPCIISPRGMLVDSLIRARSSFIKRSWIRLFEKRNLAMSSFIHVTAEKEREELSNLGLELAKTRMIPNGVRQPENVPECPLPDAWSGFRILALGRLSWKKRLDKLLLALQELPQATLLVVGPDDQGLGNELKAQARNLQVSEQLIIMAAVKEEKWYLYQNADVLALPSDSENFANVVLEAMMVGCPVLVSEQVGAADIVSQFDAGIVFDGSVEALVDALKKLTKDQAMANRMGQQGRVAAARFQWQQLVVEYENLYRDAMGQTANAIV